MTPSVATQGFALVAPALHFWYLTLSKVVTCGGTTGVLLRLGLDQAGFAPAFIAVFFSALLTLEVNQNPGEACIEFLAPHSPSLPQTHVF